MSVPKYLAQIRYVFPFRLSLPDTAFWLDFRGSATFVRVSSGRALRTLVLRPAAEREETKERYWLKATADPDDITNREVCINPTSDLFVEEVRETVGFCRMDVMFERPGQPPGANAPELSEIRESAMERAQLFIRTYRVVADEVDVSTPREDDSPVVEVGVSTRYLINGKRIEGQFSLVQREFRWTAPELTGLLKPVLAHEKVLSFSQQLESGAGPEVFNELLIEAKQLSYIHGDHRLSVVVAQAGFEAYVQWILLKEASLRGLSTLRSRRGEEASVDEAIADGDLRSELLGHYAKMFAGRSVKECREHQTWYDAAYLVRNEIAHRGRLSVAAHEACAAFEAILACANYLDAALIAGRSATPPS
jgi:hypothetical protein